MNTEVSIRLRDVVDADLAILFVQQLDTDARWMAAFTSDDTLDRDGFLARWHRILANEVNILRIIIVDGAVAGSIICYPDEGHHEIGYWLGREYWGRGIATQALLLFVQEFGVRPLYARAAHDNAASRRVLEKRGFTVVGTERGFANARGVEIEELVMRLDA